MTAQDPDSSAINEFSFLSGTPPSFFRTLFEEFPLPILFADASTGMLLGANSAGLELTGYTHQELIKLHHTQIHPSEDKEYSSQNFSKKNKIHFSILDDVVILSKDGRKIPVELTHTELDWEGRTVKIGIFRDASSLSASESQIRFLKTLIDTLPLPVFYKNSDGLYIDCNQAFCALLGLDKKLIIGKTVFDISPLEFSQRYHQADLDLLKTGKSQTYESSIYSVIHKKVQVRFHKVPLKDENGIPCGLLGVIEDLSDSKNIQKKLTEAKEKAEQAAKMKTDFLSTMSHEIRTPLNGIIGMTDILLNSELSKQDKEYVAILRQSADALLNIVTNILDSVRMDEKKVELERIPIKLDQVVHDAVEILRPVAEKKGLSLTLQFNPQIPTSLIGDPGRIAQIIVNLLNNSIKFTEKGKAHVEVTLKSQDDQQATILFHVLDTGPGIPSEIIPRLFLPFSQADSSISRKYGGTGLGLSLSRQIINLMGGEISVKSELGKGSVFTFTLTLPLFQAEVSRPTSENPTTDGLSKILIVEDDPTNQFVITSILRHTHYHFQVAGSGQEALDKVSKDNFDLILMDVQMPVMDGIEATRIIRKMDHPHRDIPIIALTADASRENAERCICAGMNGFIEKPIQKKLLLDELENILTHKNTFQFLPSTAKSFLPQDNLLDLNFLNDLQNAFEKEDFNALINTFTETANTQIAQLEVAIQRHMHENIERIAHTLKGSSANVGASKLSKLSANICLAYHDSRFDEMEIMAMGLKDILLSTVIALKKRKIS